MEAESTYERFPLRIVLLSNAVALAIYALGTVLMARLTISLAILYVGYCLWQESRLLRKSCVNCYYYGKVCAFGKGKLCALLFRPGSPEKFAATPITWAHLIPDFLVLVFPLVAGIVLLLSAFNWITLALLAILVPLAFGGNAIVRGSFACRYCRQRELGCPAEKLFSGSTKSQTARSSS